RAALERQVRDLDLEHAVHFAGHRSDVQALLAMSALFVLPSFSEGIPIGLVEAMAAGKPGGARASARVDAMWPVLADPQRAAAMAACGQARIRSAFDIEHAIAATTALYDE